MNGMAPTIAYRDANPSLLEALRATAEDLASSPASAQHDPTERISTALADELAELRDLVQVPAGTAGVVLSGIPVDPLPDPTPPSWQEAEGTAPVQRMLLTILATAAGTPFGWEGQQAGRLITDIVPTKGAEATQTGAGSSTPLELHTEDAFHPGRATEFMLLGLRNPDRVGTILSSISDAIGHLHPDDAEILAAPGAGIYPDSSYEGFDEATGEDPVSMITLWEVEGAPRLRFDPAYTPRTGADPDWWAAYDRLTKALRAEARQVPLGTGQLLIVDNDACVHGRAPFRARYDGRDRWLLRVNIQSHHPGRPAREAEEPGYGQRRTSPFRDFA